MSDCISIYITISNEETATQLAKKLVEENLVACANIIPTIKSIYKWHNEIKDNNEAAIFFKTTKALEQLAINRIKELHHYELPCVLSFDIVDGNNEFLTWINQTTMEAHNEAKQ